MKWLARDPTHVASATNPGGQGHVVRRRCGLPAHAWAWSLFVFAALPCRADTALTLNHIHGLVFAADGGQLLVSTHGGLAAYANGRWSRVKAPEHDYKGLATTHDGLYGSGHTAPSPSPASPLGLIKSVDDGRTWRQLGLAGESDFHTLAASHATNAIYVATRKANSRMPGPGIYFTLTDGRTWQRAADQGRGYMLHGLAVHPTDAAVVAAATDSGLYLSRDWADSFSWLAGGRVVIAAKFTLDGRDLWFSSYADKPALTRIAWDTGGKGEDIPIPVHADDAVAYIAQNPVWHEEFAIATFKRSVFLSMDSGSSWILIATEGITSR